MAHPQNFIDWARNKYSLASDQEAIDKLDAWDAAREQAKQCLSGEIDPQSLWTYNVATKVWEKTS